MKNKELFRQLLEERIKRYPEWIRQKLREEMLEEYTRLTFPV